MPLEVGQARGLAQDFQYDQRIADERYHSQQMERAKAINDAKAKMFTDDLDYMNAANSFDNPRIKQFAQDKIKEIGQFVQQNPDFASDVNKLSHLKQLKKDLKDNPELLRGMASDAAFKQMNEDLAEVAKNPEAYDQGAYEELLKQRDNYIRFGNQNGEEYARTEGVKSFTYQKPRNFINLAKTGQELGNKFKDMEVQMIKNGRDGAYQTIPKSASLDAAAKQYYLENKRQFDVNYTNRGVNPIEAAKEFIRSGIETKFDIGDKNTLGEQMALAKYKHSLENGANLVNQGKSPYQISVLQPGYAVTAPEDLDKTYGTKIPHFITNNDGSVKIDNTGDVFNYTGHVYDNGYRQDGKYKKDGAKIVDGYVYKTLDWAVENGIVNNPWGPDLGRQDKIDGDWSNKAEIVTGSPDKDGNSEKMVRIKVNSLVNANDPTYQGKFDSNVVTSKQRISPQESYLQQDRGTFNGLPIGQLVEKGGVRYMVTPQGLIKQ